MLWPLSSPGTGPVTLSKLHWVPFAFHSKCYVFRGAWVAQSVKCSTSVQVMISRFVGLSPVLGSVLTAGSLEPALDSVSPSLSAHTCSVSVSQKKKIFFKKCYVFGKQWVKKQRMLLGETGKNNQTIICSWNWKMYRGGVRLVVPSHLQAFKNVTWPGLWGQVSWEVGFLVRVEESLAEFWRTGGSWTKKSMRFWSEWGLVGRCRRVGPWSYLHFQKIPLGYKPGVGSVWKETS